MYITAVGYHRFVREFHSRLYALIIQYCVVPLADEKTRSPWLH